LSADAASTAGSAYDARGKTSDEIEQDIAETRAVMGSALSALQSKLAPQQLLAQGIDALQHSVSRGAAPVVRGSPGLALPCAVIGVGVFLLLRSLVKPAPPNGRDVVGRTVPVLIGFDEGPL
jgi:hypothetical protein